MPALEPRHPPPSLLFPRYLDGLGKSSVLDLNGLFDKILWISSLPFIHRRGGFPVRPAGDKNRDVNA